MPFHNQRADVPLSGIESGDRPALRLLRIAPRFYQPCLFIRSQRHIEFIKRMRETFATRFDVGFFASPAMEKSFCLLLRRKRFEGSGLARGKEAFGHVKTGEFAAYALDINSDFTISADRNQGEFAGLRKGKAD